MQEPNVYAQPSGPAGGAGGDGGGTGGAGGGGRSQPVLKPQPWQPSWSQVHILHHLMQVSRPQNAPPQAPSSRLDAGSVMSTGAGCIIQAPQMQRKFPMQHGEGENRLNVDAHDIIKALFTSTLPLPPVWAPANLRRSTQRRCTGTHRAATTNGRLRSRCSRATRRAPRAA